MSTLIKRLTQQGQEFVPISLAEAVVVNSTTIPGLSSLGITTLDKVLKYTMGVTGTNSVNISKLQETVNSINDELDKKQTKLTAGTGITISDSGVISVTSSSSVELYKIVTSLPTASKDCSNTIYLVPTSDGAAGNIFTEHLCIYNESLDKYLWEQIGEVSTDVDLSGYVTQDTFTAEIKKINVTSISASNVTTSTGEQVVVNYEIPSTLYDDAVNTDTSDFIISG